MPKAKKPQTSVFIAEITPADAALRLYSARQAARVLGVHVNTVYLWLKDGTLASRQYGGRHYIRRAALEKMGAPKP